MSSYALFLILSAITGSPLLGAVLLLVGGWAVEHYTLGLSPGPVRLVRRFLRERRLRHLLLQNPHDRRSRFELASLLIGRRRYAAALELLRANLEAGEQDAEHLFQTAVACAGCGHTEQSEKLFDQAEEEDPRFRLGAIDLERGRWRLARKDYAGAKEALQRFVATRSGTVEGRVLLSRALSGLADADAAAVMRAKAWDEFAGSPRFVRRVERLWAWRARPSRPALYAVALLVAVVLTAKVSQPYVDAVRKQMASRSADDMGGPMDPALAAQMARMWGAPRPSQGVQWALEPADPPRDAPTGWKGWRLGALRFAAPARFNASDGLPRSNVLARAVELADCEEELPRFAQPSSRPVQVSTEPGYFQEAWVGGYSTRSFITCHLNVLYSVVLTEEQSSPETESPLLLASVHFDGR